MRQQAVLLLVLLLLFCLRVVGQMVVAFTPWGGGLPPMEAWYSGLMPYGALLPCQWLTIALYGSICRDFWRGHGRFVRPHRATGRWLSIFAYGYLAVMISRYLVRMALFSHERWTGGSLPIFFHWVLAAFLIVVARYHARHAPAPPASRWLRWAGWALLPPLYVAWIFYFMAPRLLAWHLGVRPGNYAVRQEANQTVLTDDGTLLRANVFKPQHLEHSPTILVRLPHGNKLGQRIGMALAGRFWAEHGYTAVIQGVRGRGASDGTYVPFEHERGDGLATLRWIAQQPWYDGRVGTWGGSYFGYTQWSIADQPVVRAMVIQETATDFYSMLYPGGAFSLESALNWAAGDRPHQDDVTPAADLARGYASLPLAEADQRAGHRCDFFQTWVAHPTHDAYWETWDTALQRDASHANKLFMAGWFDPFLPAQLHDYGASLHRGAAVHLIIGPWGHARSVPLPEGARPRHYRFDSLAPTIAFYDAFLADQPDTLAPVRYYLMGANVWRDAAQWPPAGATAQRWALHSHGQRLDRTPSDQSDMATYLHDPNHPVPSEGGAVLDLAAALSNTSSAGLPAPSALHDRPDMLTFTSAPLPGPVDLLGPQAVELDVSSEAPCTEFVATLLDVWPDGSAFPYSQGARRIDHAATPQRIRLDLWPTALRLAVGHRLQLRISSSSHPRFAVHPNVCADAAHVTGVHPARQTVRLEQSALILSAMAGDAP